MPASTMVRPRPPCGSALPGATRGSARGEEGGEKSVPSAIRTIPVPVAAQAVLSRVPQTGRGHPECDEHRRDERQNRMRGRGPGRDWTLLPRVRTRRSLTGSRARVGASTRGERHEPTARRPRSRVDCAAVHLSAVVADHVGVESLAIEREVGGHEAGRTRAPPARDRKGDSAAGEPEQEGGSARAPRRSCRIAVAAGSPGNARTASPNCAASSALISSFDRQRATSARSGRARARLRRLVASAKARRRSGT